MIDYLQAEGAFDDTRHAAYLTSKSLHGPLEQAPAGRQNDTRQSLLQRQIILDLDYPMDVGFIGESKRLSFRLGDTPKLETHLLSGRDDAISIFPAQGSRDQGSDQ